MAVVGQSSSSLELSLVLGEAFFQRSACARFPACTSGCWRSGLPSRWRLASREPQCEHGDRLARPHPLISISKRQVGLVVAGQEAWR